MDMDNSYIGKGPAWREKSTWNVWVVVKDSSESIDVALNRED